MDIGSGHGYPADALSNFAPHPFVFRGLPVASMEGLLQGLKFENPELQRHVLTLVGRAAKFKGKPKKWWRTQTLYWQGEPLDRHGEAYQQLLDEAFGALFTQNAKARAALLATQEAVLQHSIGKSNVRETVLTRAEFTSRLTRLRAEFQRGAAQEPRGLSPATT